MNVAGMILGIIAVIFAFIPVLGAFFAVPCLVIGLPLSAVDFVKKKRLGEGLGMAIAGMVTSIIALVMVVGWGILVVIGIVASES